MSSGTKGQNYWIMCRIPLRLRCMGQSSKAAKHRLYVESWISPITPLTPEQTHYLRNVLRLQNEEAILAFDAKGRAHQTELVPLEEGKFGLRIGEPAALPEQPLKLSVAMPIPKGDRADWTVEKLTELGVTNIIWWQAERSVMKSPGEQKMQRWLRLAQSAARQSLCGAPATIEGPIPLKDIFLSTYEQHFIALPKAEPSAKISIGQRNSVLLLIGPEGGFTPDEEAFAIDAGCQPLWLSCNILRMETAAIAGASHLQNMAQKF